MADRTEEIRRHNKRMAAEEKKESTDFEREGKAFYRAQGKTILSWGAERHLEVFDVPLEEKAADFVVSDGPHSIIVSEAKGADIAKALEQLKNLATYVQRKEPHKQIEFHILLRAGTNPDNLAPAINQPASYRARSTNYTVLRKTRYVLTNGADVPIRIALNSHEAPARVFAFIGPRSA